MWTLFFENYFKNCLLLWPHRTENAASLFDRLCSRWILDLKVLVYHFFCSLLWFCMSCVHIYIYLYFFAWHFHKCGFFLCQFKRERNFTRPFQKNRFFACTFDYNHCPYFLCSYYKCIECFLLGWSPPTGFILHYGVGVEPNWGPFFCNWGNKKTQ